MIITFFGHSSISSSSLIKEQVKDAVRKHAFLGDPVSFYLGGYGDFDEICASACRELRKEYKTMEIIYVTPYMEVENQKKILEWQNNGVYDSTIYPPIEKVPPRLAILKRNEWMVKNSDIIIAYVKYNYGGACKALQIAKRNKKTVINICDFEHTD